MTLYHVSFTLYSVGIIRKKCPDLPTPGLRTKYVGPLAVREIVTVTSVGPPEVVQVGSRLRMSPLSRKKFLFTSHANFVI